MKKLSPIQSKKQFNKIIFAIILLLLLLIKLRIIKLEILNIKIYFLRKYSKLEIYYFDELMNEEDKNNTILIFEPNDFHYECTPGYVEYFLKLGYNVDILMHRFGIETINVFNITKNIRLFIYDKIDNIYIHSQELSSIIKQYYLILIETADKNVKLFNKLGLFDTNNSIFTVHELDYLEKNVYSKYFKQNRIWTLGNFSIGLQVNPHYFGEINLKNKNKITRFFVTSTRDRDYYDLINSAEKLIKQNYNFEIIVIGYTKNLNRRKIPKKIYNNFQFNFKISCDELYRKVENSDFIIIPLDANIKNDNRYKTSKITGSILLSYGFLKPSLINEEFAPFYKLNHKNSLIYNNSYNLYNVMKDAIIINNYNYKNLQLNLKTVAKNIYKTSLYNIKKVLNKV